jgi:putative redox protein
MSTTPSVTAVNGATAYVVTLEDNRGHHWLSDEPLEAGGANKGPPPTQLLLSSLGACTAITVRMYAERKGWPLTGVEVKLVFNPDGPPAEGSEIRRSITLQGDLTAAQREQLLGVANKCPIHRVLTGRIHIDSSLTAA